MKRNSKGLTAILLFGCLFSALSIAAKAQALSDAFRRSTVLVTYPVTRDETASGTGFFVLRPVTGQGGYVLLVTNKHTLPPEGQARAIKIRVVVGSAENSSVRFVEIPVVGQNGKYLPNVRLHPKPGFDVAAVNVTDAIVGEGLQGTWLPLELFSTPDLLKNENITVGDEIFLLGFPDTIFDARNVSPILRTGVIATVPIEGYAFNDALRRRFGLPDRIDGFLIDANVFPGSSGSIVILKQQSATSIPYVLGIVSGSIPISDAALGSTQRMGLGIVYSANAIREVVDLF